MEIEEYSCQLKSRYGRRALYNGIKIYYMTSYTKVYSNRQAIHSPGELGGDKIR